MENLKSGAAAVFNNTRLRIDKTGVALLSHVKIARVGWPRPRRCMLCQIKRGEQTRHSSIRCGLQGQRLCAPLVCRNLPGERGR